jgi:hypothetical protein
MLSELMICTLDGPLCLRTLLVQRTGQELFPFWTRLGTWHSIIRMMAFICWITPWRSMT